ncbi:hypothetical protein GDO78_005449 [Eleutherodactylus coqui]|uniref:Uncharacterized protein n=1 Tax=Eleutherodactylus coqui TaxID=57060 RepID=A0A8J6FK38_ELECQ|nr:hypothetical protein GDO78_005449 [Eleutherodactylus coqui]
MQVHFLIALGSGLRGFIPPITSHFPVTYCNVVEAPVLTCCTTLQAISSSKRILGSCLVKTTLGSRELIEGFPHLKVLSISREVM